MQDVTIFGSFTEETLKVINWLKKQLNVVDFSWQTQYYIDKLDVDFNYDNELDEPEKEQLLAIVRAHTEWEKEHKADYQRRVLVAVANEIGTSKDAEQAFRKALAQVEQQPIQEATSIKQGAKKKDEAGEPPKNAALADFNTEEIEGIKAVAAYHAVLYGYLPKVQAFRAEFLRGKLLTREAAMRFLASPAIRYLSAADITRAGCSVAKHDAKVVAYEQYRLSQAQRNRLEGESVVYPVSPHYTIEGASSSWTKFSVTVELKPTGEHNQPTTVPKTLLTERTPHMLLRELFVREPSAAPNMPQGFPRFFADSVADKLWAVIDPRTSSLPGRVYEAAWFVLTGILPTNTPVSVSTGRGAFQGSSQDSKELAKRLANAEAHRSIVTINAEPWVTSDTIKSIYEKAQAPFLTSGLPNAAASPEPAGKKRTRYKMPQVATLHLVTEVVSIYERQPENFTMKHAYDVLHQSGKVTGKCESFRQAYQRACQTLYLPPDIKDIAQQLAQMK